MDSIASLKEVHNLMHLVQTIDIGLIVIDRNYDIHIWNGFMESHSGQQALQVKGENLFSIFQELPEDWLRHKVDSVFLLNCRSFMTWEQRPYLFKFKNYRPITGTEEYMHQNITIAPIVGTTGEVESVAIMIYDVTDIASKKKALTRANDELEKLSRTDGLTQLNNRAYWEQCLEREFQRNQRYQVNSSLVMFDIDHFKSVNDTYGHQAGDEVIRQVAKVLRDSLRRTDIAGRYGGEEFGVILSDTSAESAFNYCERLRKNIEALCVVHEDKEIKFTVSLGVSQASSEQTSRKVWLEEADQALYSCKENGRNQTQIFGKKS